MKINDDVIIAGKIVKKLGKVLMIKLPSGLIAMVTEKDIKSIRPYIEQPTKDLREGK